MLGDTAFVGAPCPGRPDIYIIWGCECWVTQFVFFVGAPGTVTVTVTVNALIYYHDKSGSVRANRDVGAPGTGTVPVAGQTDCQCLSLQVNCVCYCSTYYKAVRGVAGGVERGGLGPVRNPVL